MLSAKQERIVFHRDDISHGSYDIDIDMLESPTIDEFALAKDKHRNVILSNYSYTSIDTKELFGIYDNNYYTDIKQNNNLINDFQLNNTINKENEFKSQSNNENIINNIQLNIFNNYSLFDNINTQK